MDRRGFLKRLFAGAAGVALAPVLDLERLLWVPGEKTIFLPPVTEFGLVTPDWVTREALRILEGKLTLAGSLNREFDDTYRLGDHVRLSLPGGLSKAFHVTDQSTIELDDSLYAMTRDQARDRVLEPAAAAFASRMKQHGHNALAPLPLPASGGVFQSSRAENPAGHSLRLVTYSVEEDRMYTRLDILSARA